MSAALHRQVRFRIAALAALAVLLAPTALAQQASVFRTDVNLIQIEAVVLDEHGVPVRGLSAADFELVDRGVRQQIVGFSEIAHGSEPSSAIDTHLPPTLVRDVASNASTRTDRTVVLVIDDLHIYRGRAETTKELARRVVRELGPSASMAVLFTSGEHSTQIVEDRGLLLAAVETAEGRKAVRRPHGVCESPARADCSLQDFFENMHFYETLEDAARMLGAADGRRKSFVLVSEGIPISLEGLFGTRTEHLGGRESDFDVDAGGRTGITGGFDVPTGGSSYHLGALRTMVSSLQRSGVAVYAIDPRGFVSQQELAQECFPPPVIPGFELRSDRCAEHFRWASDVRHAQDGLAILADTTGGFAVVNTDQLDAGLTRILDDLDHYYLLGFTPTDDDGGNFRPVDVVVNRPGTTVRYRRGYAPGGPPPPPKNDDPLKELSAGVMAVSDVPLRMTANALPGGPRGAVSVAVSLEAAWARPETEESAQRFSYLLFAVKEKNGEPVASVSGSFQLGPQAARGFQIDAGLALAPGRYQLRASVQAESVRTGGSVYLTVDVPDFARAELAVSSMALAHAGRHRLPVMRATDQATSNSPEGLPFSPTLDREFASTDTLRVFAQVSTRRQLTGVRPRFLVHDVARDRIVSEFTPPMDDDGRIDVTMRLATLAPGGYVIRLVASDGTATATRETGIVIR